MRSIYRTWLIALVLKLVGASWDVSWHFRFLRETLSPAHLTNLAGDLLVAALLVYEYKHLEKHRRAPLLLVGLGTLVFLVAIPFDQWWHLTFGIDLTTWSPSHLMLFYGTAIVIAGVVLLFLADLKHERGTLAAAAPSERIALALLLILLAEALAFPLAYNEYSTLAAANACSATPSIDPALVAAAVYYSKNCTDLSAAIFHGTPVWLYPIYSIAFAVFLGTLVRASLGPGWATVTLVGLTLERALANAIIVRAGFPAAVVPLQYIAIGFGIELAWMMPTRTRAKAIVGALLATLASYAYFTNAPAWLAHVPIDGGSAIAATALAALLALAALALSTRAERMASVVRDRDEWERVADWAQEKWDAIRS